MSKGIKLVSSDEFNAILHNFDTHKKTRAVKMSRPIVRNRADKHIYHYKDETGAPEGMTFRAIGVDGFSVAENVLVTFEEADKWVESRIGVSK